MTVIKVVVAALCAAGVFSVRAETLGGALKVASGETKVIDGRGKTWKQVLSPGAKGVDFMTGGDATLYSVSADMNLEDFTIRFSRDAAGVRGTLLDIDAKRCAYPSMNGGQGCFGSWGKAGDPSGAAMVRFRNADLQIVNLIFAAFNQPTNRLVAANCRGIFGIGCRDNPWAGLQNPPIGTPGLREYWVTENSVVTNAQRFFTGYHVEEKGKVRFSSRGKTFRVRVDKGSRLYQNSLVMDSAGSQEVLVSGKGSRYENYGSQCVVGTGADATGLVRVTDGATFASTIAPLTLGPQSAKSFATSRASLVADAGVLDLPRGLSLENGELTLQNGTTASFGGLSVGKTGKDVALSVDGSTVAFAGTSLIGNGTLAVRKGQLAFEGVTTLGDVKATVVDSVLTVGPKGKLRGKGDLPVDGVTLEVKPRFYRRGMKADPVPPFGGFATVTVGPKGLTIACDEPLVIDQSFAGKGTLTLKGAGEKRLVGDVRTSRLVVSGGDVTVTGECAAKVTSSGKTLVTVGNEIVSFGGWRNEEVLRRFRDRSRFDLVEIREGLGYDLAQTTNRPSSVRWFHRETNTVCTAVVPCRQYVRAWVLCSLDEKDAKKDRRFTVRLTRYANKTMYAYEGRSRRGMADSYVDFDTAKKEKLPDGRWLVEVPLETGNIQDVLYTDRHGNYDHPTVAAEMKRRKLSQYLDLEFLGRTREVQQHLWADNQDADRTTPSAVTVYDVALERPPCEMRMLWTEPGNIFHNDEKPETKVALTVHRPGKYELSWIVRNPEGEVVATGAQPVTASGTNTVSLAQKEVGWYKLDWTLKDGVRTLLTHSASFALLGKDTRTTGLGEGPFGSGHCCGVSHYLVPYNQYDVAGALMFKAGFRHSYWTGLPVEKAEQWKIDTVICAKFPEYWRQHLPKEKWPTDEQIKERIAKNLKNFPTANTCMIFHESANKPYQQAEEVFGGTHDPKNDLADADLHFQQAMRAAEFMRTNFPNVKIMLGSSLVCTELIAELIRRGFPNKYADYMGLESVVRENLPERITSSSLQGADHMRELAKHYKYTWTPNPCFESDYRRHSILGYDRQAKWYVRDMLLQQCWMFPNIYVGHMVTVGNHYSADFWGDAGVCERWPMLYPFRAYVGLATATKILDGVTGRRIVPTGDGGPYLVEFARKDGKYAYAYWTSYGECDLELTTSQPFVITDFFGRTRQPKRATLANLLPGGKKRYIVRAGEGANYIVADAPIVLSAQGGRWEHPAADKEAEKYKTFADTSNFDAWTVSNGLDCGMTRKLGNFPSRVPGKGVARAVDDPEKGKVIELELVDADYTLPVNVDEYTTLILKEPIRIPGRPLWLGMWVKGNSAMGNAYFILRDSKGNLWTDSGHPGLGIADELGRTSVCFSGWRYMTIPLTRYGSVSPWIYWSRATFTEYPATLVGVAFSAQNRPLILDERKPLRQFIQIGGFGCWGELPEKKKGKK